MFRTILQQRISKFNERKFCGECQKNITIRDRYEIRLDFALPCTVAANYTILKQLIADKLQKRAEEPFTAAITAASLLKQLQEATEKVAEEAALPEDLQEGQTMI